MTHPRLVGEQGPEIVLAAALSSADINNLPDSAFAYIEPGGSKDSEGKTVPRSKRHFPIHDAAHVRNALARAPQSPFGDKAMAAIRRACKKFGIRWSGMKGADSKVYAAAMTSQMLGVELARPGTWHLSSGRRTFSAENLQDAADFFAASGQTRIPIGFGHHDSRFDGDPAFGWVSNIRYTTDAKGPVLLGDLVDMEDWVAAAAPARWPNRSIEGFANLDWNGRTYSLALTRLALLGSTPPAMPTLRSLSDLREAVAAAAESSHAEFIAASVAPQLTSADVAVEPHQLIEEEGTGMDPAKFRARLGERLGIDPDDLDDDEVMADLAEAGFVPQAEAPADATPVAASGLPVDLAAAVDTSGATVVLASGIYQQLVDDNKRFRAFMEKSERSERDAVIAQAIQDGKLTPAQREYFATAWDRDPKNTRALLGALTSNRAFAVSASGYSTGNGEWEEDELDREIARLTPPRASKGGVSNG